MVLKPLESADPTPAIRIVTCRFQQILNHGTYLVPLAIRLIIWVIV
jgi:hypothetical protein